MHQKEGGAPVERRGAGGRGGEEGRHAEFGSGGSGHWLETLNRELLPNTRPFAPKIHLARIELATFSVLG